MKHTRKPVDYLVKQAKQIQEQNKILPIYEIEININGIKYKDITNKKLKNPTTEINVDVISYGVQDLIYTRVFTIIVVTSETEAINPQMQSPFMCHSFLCSSRAEARQITFALAAAFQDYGKRVKKENLPSKKFAIDLRTPEEQQADGESETEA